MFASWLKRSVILTALTGIGTAPLLSEDLKEMLDTLKLLSHLPKITESRTLKSDFPCLLYLYDTQQIEKLDPRLEKVFEKSPEYGYQVQKRFIGSDSDALEIKEKLSMTDEEIELRLKHNSNFVFVHGEKSYKAPMGIQLKDIDSWVAKCQQPVIKLESTSQFYGFCRKIIGDDEDFVLVYRGLSCENRKVAELYSRLKYKLPVLELPDEVCEELGIPEGVTVIRSNSKYDGDFLIEVQGKLKNLNLPLQDLTLELLDSWVKSNSTPVLAYIDSYEKIYPMFSRVYNGSLKVVYVLTSQLNPYSKNYDKILQSLIKISQKYSGEISIVILPNDDIAKKLGVLRNKKLRKFRTPELRFLDFGKLIDTTKVNNEFPIIDCSSDKSKCGELVDSHYTRKNNFDKKITDEALEEFFKKSLAGEFEQYYEVDTIPCPAVRKLCGKDFVGEVIEADRDVLVEFYGKYCPGCMRFKKDFNEIAEELKQKGEDVAVARICVDYNMVSEISGKKPYTPIFWLYKKGLKSDPVRYDGKFNKADLKSFILENLTKEQV